MPEEEEEEEDILSVAFIGWFETNNTIIIVHTYKKTIFLIILKENCKLKTKINYYCKIIGKYCSK